MKQDKLIPETLGHKEASGRRVSNRIDTAPSRETTPATSTVSITDTNTTAPANTANPTLPVNFNHIRADEELNLAYSARAKGVSIPNYNPNETVKNRADFIESSKKLMGLVTQCNESVARQVSKPTEPLPPGLYTIQAQIKETNGKVSIHPDWPTAKKITGGIFASDPRTPQEMFQQEYQLTPQVETTKTIQSKYSDPSHLDWKLQNSLAEFGINPAKETQMSEYRANNPKPELFDLIHRWNLSEEQQTKLDFYRLHSMTAAQLEIHLRNNNNRIYHSDEPRIIFVPIYQHVSRQQIRFDALGKNYKHRYYLSFRAVSGNNIVLIQRSKHSDY